MNMVQEAVFQDNILVMSKHCLQLNNYKVFNKTVVVKLNDCFRYVYKIISPERPKRFLVSSTKTSPCNEHPLTSHFYIVKLGFTGVYIFSYFCSKTLIVGTR